MNDYNQCVRTVSTHLTKKGVKNVEHTAQNMCSMWADENGIERKFSVNDAVKQGEVKRRFASANEFMEYFNKDESVWEFPVRAITSGPHEYTDDAGDQKVYIESSILKDNMEAFKELPIYYTHQRTPDDLIGTAINPEIEEMDNGKIAVRMLAKISDDSERAIEVIKKMKEGDVTNVSIDWFSKDVDVMGDTYATSIRPVEISFIDNEIATPVCDACTIDMKCDSHSEREFADTHDCGCGGKEGGCECAPHGENNNEVDTMVEQVVTKTDAETITEREFASYKKQLDELTSNYTELQSKYDDAIKAITEFETANEERVAKESQERKATLVNSILDREILVKGLEEDGRQVRFNELAEWDENKLNGFEEALASIPEPTESEKTFGKGKAHEADVAPREEPEAERLFAMKDGKLHFNREAL